MIRSLLLFVLLCWASLANAQNDRLYTIGETIDIEFTTVGADGAPATLASTPAVAVFRGSGTTALTTGVTLTVDAGSVTGLNKVRILTSDSSFLPDVNYSVRLTAGATDVSLVGATVGRFRLVRVDDQSGMNTAERMLRGLSVVGGIGDSYMSSVAAWRGVMDWLIADGRFVMRGENVLIDGMNPFSTKGGAAQPGIRVPVAAGATFPGTAVVNRQYYSAESVWSGTLANGNAFTPGNLGNDIAADVGGYFNPNRLPTDIGSIDAFISYIGTANSVTSIRNRIRRGVSVGIVDAPSFNPSLSSGYAANHYTLTTMGGSSGSIDMIAQLQANMTSQVWIQLGYGAVAKDRTMGIVYGSIIGQGGAGVSHFSSSATPASGISYTDDQIDAWFAAQAVTGYPVDTLIVHLGINNGDGENVTADYLTLLDRWITIGQQYTTKRFGVLCVTPAPYITNSVDKTSSALAKRDQIAAAVEAYGDPTRVQLIDVAQKMIDHHGSVMDWGPTYLVQDGTNYLHPSVAGGPVFGAAFYAAVQDAANDIQPTVKRAVELLALASQASVDDVPTAAETVTAINADGTQTTARTNAATAATQSTTAATESTTAAAQSTLAATRAATAITQATAAAASADDAATYAEDASQDAVAASAAATDAANRGESILLELADATIGLQAAKNERDGLATAVDAVPNAAEIETAAEAAIDDKLPVGATLIAGAGATAETLDDIETSSGVGTAPGGALLNARLGAYTLADEKYVKIVQGEEKQLTFIVEPSRGMFQDAVPDEITVKLRDTDASTTLTIADADVTRVTNELDLQIFRVTLSPENTELLEAGVLKVEIDIDGQKARVNDSIKIEEGL